MILLMGMETFSITMIFVATVFFLIMTVLIVLSKISEYRKNRNLICRNLPKDVYEPVKIYGHFKTRMSIRSGKLYTVSYKTKSGETIYLECNVSGNSVSWHR